MDNLKLLCTGHAGTNTVSEMINDGSVFSFASFASLAPLAPFTPLAPFASLAPFVSLASSTTSHQASEMNFHRAAKQA